MTKEKETEDSSAKDEKNEKSTDTKITELSEEQWELAFAHPRFKELNLKAKELEKLKEDQKKAEEQKLKEQEEYKTLADKYQQDNENLKKQITNQMKKQSVISEAIKSGVRKDAIDDVVKLVDIDSLEVDESGNPINTSEKVKSLLESKPYLLADEGKKNIGADKGTNDTGKSQFWKWSEIQKKSRDHAWYEANKVEIELAKKEGRINYSE